MSKLFLAIILFICTSCSTPKEEQNNKQEVKKQVVKIKLVKKENTISLKDTIAKIVFSLDYIERIPPDPKFPHEKAKTVNQVIPRFYILGPKEHQNGKFDIDLKIYSKKVKNIEEFFAKIIINGKVYEDDTIMQHPRDKGLRWIKVQKFNWMVTFYKEKDVEIHNKEYFFKKKPIHLITGKMPKTKLPPIVKINN